MLTKDSQFFATPSLSQWDRLHVALNTKGDSYQLKFFQADRWPDVAITAPSWDAQKFIQRFPDSKQTPKPTFAGDIWVVPVTDISTQIINAWPEERRAFSADAKAKFAYVQMELVSQAVSAKVCAEFKLNGVVPADFDYDISETLPLRDHQKVGLYNGMVSPSYAFYMQQGTGKTPIGVALICNAAKRRTDKSKKFCAIVVCPKAVRTNWANEFKHFATTCGKVTIIRGNEIDRIKCFADAFNTPDQAEFTVVVCNYETLANTWNALQMITWDVAILDESHFIKSISTKRFKYAIKLRNNSQRRYIMTGTPITNSAMDLYAQLEFLGEGKSGFGSFAAFKRFYGVWETGGSGFSKLVGMQNLPLMKDRLARLSFMCTREEVLKDLPPKQYSTHEVNMTAKQAKVYKEMLTNLQAKFEGYDESSAMTVNHMLTQLLRLNQITSGFVKLDDDVRDVQDETGEWVQEIVKKGPVIQISGDNPKLDAIAEMAKALEPNEKMIAWTCFKEDVRAIKERLQAEGIECVTYDGSTSEANRDLFEYQYNSDINCKVFIGNSRAGGTGLNLLGYDSKSDNPIDANTVKEVFYSQNFSVTDRLQAEDRACRTGQRVPVEIVDLMVPMSIDEEIRERVEGKKQHAMEVSDVKNILKGLLGKTLEINGN